MSSAKSTKAIIPSVNRHGVALIALQPGTLVNVRKVEVSDCVEGNPNVVPALIMSSMIGVGDVRGTTMTSSKQMKELNRRRLVVMVRTLPEVYELFTVSVKHICWSFGPLDLEQSASLTTKMTPAVSDAPKIDTPAVTVAAVKEVKPNTITQPKVTKPRSRSKTATGVVQTPGLRDKPAFA